MPRLPDLAAPTGRALGVVVLVLVLISGAVLYWFRETLESTARFSWNVGLTDVRIGSFEPDRDLRLRRPDGVTLMASAYEPEGTHRARILLLHGNTPSGRMLPLYRLLGAELAEAGYYVLALDLAGFGESGDPFSTGSLESLDIGIDVGVALDSLDGFAPGAPVILVAHSGGAAPALKVGLGHPMVSGIALLGPPRRTADVLSDPELREYFFERAQETHARIYGEPIPEWYTMEVWLEQAMNEGALPSLQIDMDRYLGELSNPAHEPVLLIDNGWESSDDLTYLRNYHSRISEPKEYETVPDSDHYFNTRTLGRWVLYDATTARRVVGRVDRWIRDTVAPRSKPGRETGSGGT